MTAARLEAAMREAWPKVKADPGWTDRGGPWTFGKPIGVMHHHTAQPVPFPIRRLNGNSDARIKCNINTKPDGTIWLVAYEACNFSSGMGSSIVRDEVLAGTPPTKNAQNRGLLDNTNGNPLFFNFENDHAGTGQPLPVIQHDAITVGTDVVNEHFGLTAGNVISHAEWTARKRDPFWDGNRRAIEDIRANLADMPLSDADLAAVREVMVEVLGGDRIQIPNVGNEPFPRHGNQGIVNSTLHAHVGGRKISLLISDAAKAAIAASKDTEALLTKPPVQIDVEALAEKLMVALEPQLRPIIATELAKLVLEARTETG